jgi:starch-binding outer membrane protein, SusD/RagB family
MNMKQRKRWVVAPAALLALTAALTACDTGRLLDVKAPGRVPAEIFDSPAQANLMVNSAIADFECAFGVFVLIQGVVSDEFADAQLGAVGWDYDRRTSQPNGLYGTGTCTSNQLPGLYTPLSTARWAAESALNKLQGWTDAEVVGRGALIAKAALYTGFSYALMGMSMCEAAFDLSAPMDQQQMFAEAEERFTTAIAEATAAGLADVANAARVGRARVRLFQNKTAEAIADAQAVPQNFEFEASAESDQNRRYNRIFAAMTFSGFYTVESQSRDIRTGGVPDPRAAVVRPANVQAADPAQTIYTPAKYTSLATPMTIARWEEAQLIIAEASGGATAVGIVNALRARHSLPAYTGPTDAASIRQLIADERRRELFAEGFRNFDLQRFELPLTPAAGTVYPSKGGFYGNVLCFPLPDIERVNNPNIP